MSDVTRILAQIEKGDPAAAEQLLPLVYDELRKLAAVKLRDEKPGQTLQATALVHEAYLRLVGPAGPAGPDALGDTQVSSRPAARAHWQSRGHFLAAAAAAMRRILVEAARRKQSERHGGGRVRGELDLVEGFRVPLDGRLLDLDESLTKLAIVEPACAELVKLRIFAGMTIAEAAEAQGVSARTAKRNWAYARAWLGRQLAAYDPART